MKRIWILPLSFVLSFGGAFALSSGRDDGDEPTSTSVAPSASPAAAPIPVLAPIAVDVDPATVGDPPQAGTDGADDSTGGPVVSRTAATRAAAATGPTPLAADATPTELATSLTGGFAPELTRDAGRAKPTEAGPTDGLPSGDDVGVGVFVDPCAGVDASDVSETEECRDGVAGTVLAIRAPAAMEAVLFVEPDHVDATIPGWRRCDYPDGAGVRAVLVTNNPVDSGYVVFHDAYDIAATRGRFDLEPTSDAERRRWEASSTYPSDFWESPQQCLRVPVGTTRGTQWSITAWVDGLGGDDATFAGWTIPDDRGRPPVTISFDGANHVRVVAPVRSDGMVVSVAAFPFGPEGTGTCATHEAAGTTPAATATSDRRVLPEERLAAAVREADAYAYLPSWDAVKQLVLELDEGTYYHLCLRWYAQAASFDPSTIVDREARFVALPDRRRLEVRVVGHELVRPTAEGTISVFVARPDGAGSILLEDENPATGACSAALPDGASFRGGSRTVLAEPVVLCGTAGRVDDLLPFPEIDVVTQVRGADRQRVRIPVDLKSRGARSELYRIPLSGARRLCGTGPFGGGCDGNRDDFGALTVELSYSDGRRTGTFDGWVGEPTTWTGPAPTRPEPSADVQLDQFDDIVVSDGVTTVRPRTYAMPVVDRTDAIELHLRADRPATAVVRAHPQPGSELCLRAGDGTARGRVSARVDTRVVVGGLCARTHYWLEVELTAADGRVTRFGPYGTTGWNQAETYGWEAEWGISATIETYPGADDVAMLEGEITIGGRPVDLRDEGPHPAETANRCFAGRNRIVQRIARQGFYGDEVTFDVRIVLGDYVPPVSAYYERNYNRCIHFGFSGEPRANVVEDSLVVSTRELFGGGFTRTLSDGRGLRIVVRVQPTYLAPGPGYDFDDDRRAR